MADSVKFYLYIPPIYLRYRLSVSYSRIHDDYRFVLFMWMKCIYIYNNFLELECEAGERAGKSAFAYDARRCRHPVQ
jgi:hypothetical protein